MGRAGAPRGRAGAAQLEPWRLGLRQHCRHRAVRRGRAHAELDLGEPLRRRQGRALPAALRRERPVPAVERGRPDAAERRRGRVHRQLRPPGPGPGAALRRHQGVAALGAAGRLGARRERRRVPRRFQLRGPGRLHRLVQGAGGAGQQPSLRAAARRPPTQQLDGRARRQLSRRRRRAPGRGAEDDGRLRERVVPHEPQRRRGHVGRRLVRREQPRQQLLARHARRRELRPRRRRRFAAVQQPGRSERPAALHALHLRLRLVRHELLVVTRPLRARDRRARQRQHDHPARRPCGPRDPGRRLLPAALDGRPAGGLDRRALAERGRPGAARRCSLQPIAGRRYHRRALGGYRREWKLRCAGYLVRSGPGHLLGRLLAARRGARDRV